MCRGEPRRWLASPCLGPRGGETLAPLQTEGVPPEASPRPPSDGRDIGFPAPGAGRFSAVKEAFPGKSHRFSEAFFFPLCSLQEKGNAAAPQAGRAVAPQERPGSRRWISTLLSVKSHDHGSQFPPALDPGRRGCERAPGFAKRLSPLAADILVSHVGLRCIQRSGNRSAGEHPAPR